MKVIKSQVGYEGTEHFVIEVTGEPTMIDFVQQVDDLLISSPDGDILVSWDNKEFSRTNCLLVTSKDNLKEITKVSITHFYIMARDPNATFTVYVTGQRN